MSLILSAVAALAFGEATQEIQSLRLVCPGVQYSTETSSGYTSGMVGGDLVSGQTTLQSRVTIPGAAKLTFDGNKGSIQFPDGSERELTNVVWTEDTIAAKYRRLIYTYNVTVNRRTGDIVSKMLHIIGFRGSCEQAPAESNEQKF